MIFEGPCRCWELLPKGSVASTTCWRKNPSLMMKTHSRVELNHQNTKVKLSISILLIMYFPIIENQKKLRFPKKKRHSHGGFLSASLFGFYWYFFFGVGWWLIRGFQLGVALGMTSSHKISPQIKTHPDIAHPFRQSPAHPQLWIRNPFQNARW